MYEDNSLAVKQATDPSLSGAGSGTAPTTSTNLGQIVTPRAGLYKVCASVMYSAGTPAALEDTNWRLRVGSTQVKTLLATRTLGVVTKHEHVVRVDGTQNIDLRVNATGTTGVTYNGEISATRIGN